MYLLQLVLLQIHDHSVELHYRWYYRQYMRIRNAITLSMINSHNTESRSVYCQQCY